MIPAIGSALPRLDAAQGTSQASPGSAISGGAAAAGPDFSAVLAEVASDAVNTMRGAEATSIKGLQGSASTQAVVEAVMAAERTLQTAVAVRDKAVAAYLDLSRMAI